MKLALIVSSCMQLNLLLYSARDSGVVTVPEIVLNILAVRRDRFSLYLGQTRLNNRLHSSSVFLAQGE